MRTHGTSLTVRIVAGVLVAAALMAATTAAAAAEPVSSDSFAAGWQSHARDLIYKGPARAGGSTKWLVPRIMPRGRYVLIQRDGDKAELIPGYQFEVTGDAFRDINMWVPANYMNIAAIPISDLPAAKVPSNDRSGQL
jgi:hypothetical protein